MITRIVINIVWPNFQDMLSIVGKHPFKFQLFLSKFKFSQFVAYSTRSGPFPCYPLYRDFHVTHFIDKNFLLRLISKRFSIKIDQVMANLVLDWSRENMKNRHQCIRTFITATYLLYTVQGLPNIVISVWCVCYEHSSCHKLAFFNRNELKLCLLINNGYTLMWGLVPMGGGYPLGFGNFWEIGKIDWKKALFPMNFFPKVPNYSKFLILK